MTLVDRLRALADALPSDRAAVTLTRADLVALVADADSPSPPRPTRDMSVEEVAEEVGRAPSTVRGWLIAGDLRGYKLNRRDWRVTRSALDAYLRGQTESPSRSEDDPAAVDISAWRRGEATR